MRLRVLGSAAGGGFPQWNCGCPNCSGVRAGSIAARPRTQASLALSGDGESWILLGASPDVHAQIEAFAPLHPRSPRHTPIAAVALPNGDLDACLGLLLMRESQPFAVHATRAVMKGLRERNVMFRTLERGADRVTWHPLALGLRQSVAPGLSLEAVALPGKVPLHLEGQAPDAADNVGLVVRDDAGHSVAWFPSLAGPSEAADRCARAADVLFCDGTFFADDELIALGLGSRRARDMAHWPLGGPEGSLRWLAGLPTPRKLLVHINNTNPLLREDAPERAALAGVEVAWDGLEIEL
jgi:pyrroloquinoline quinone biosynthesis protein B